MRIWGAQRSFLLVAMLSSTWPYEGQQIVAPQSARFSISLAAKGEASPGPGQIFLGKQAGAGSQALDWKGEPLVVEVPAGSSWELSAEVPGSWVSPQVLVAGPAATTVKVAVPAWPATSVTGSLKLPAGAPFLPGLVLATLEASPLQRSSQAIGRGSARCPVDAEGHFECSLPAGTAIDVAFRVEGYVPQYRWGLELVAGKTHELGPLLLVEGASLAGWLTTAEGEFDPSKAFAQLMPMQGPQGEARTSTRLRAAAHEAKPRPDGFFQFLAVPPGRYTLEAKYPGFAPARVSPIEVLPGRESAIREMVTLRRPLTLELALSPPVDWLGKPWHVRLSRSFDLSGANDPGFAFDGPAPETGVLRTPDLAPGRFDIDVFDASGNAFHSEQGHVVEGESGEVRLEIQLRAIQVEGTLTLGNEPLSGTVIFGTRFGVLRSRMEADSEGHFTGVLAKDGPWRVEVIAEVPRIEARAQVEVKDREPVLIALPDTLIFGVVVDELGQPAPGAQVEIQAPAPNHASLVAGPEGRFEARALPEGPVLLSARHATSPTRKLSSDGQKGHVAEDEPLGPIRLVLRERKACEGRVISSLGPVPGAVVSTMYSTGNPDSARATTDLEGRFVLDVASASSLLELLVQAPGYGLEVFEANCGADPNELFVSELQGSLTLRIPEEAPDDTQREATRLLVFQNGRNLSLGDLFRWAMGHGVNLPAGGSFVAAVPAMAPGHYQFCKGSLRPLLLREISIADWAETQAKCVEGRLSAGGSLELEAPRNVE